jgi:NTE family protein
VGGAYASGMSPDELEGRVDEYLHSPEFQSSAIKAFESAHERGEMGLTKKIQSYLKNHFYVVQAMFKPGILSSEDFEAAINHFIPDIQIEETRIVFRSVATDLVTGEQIIFSEGSLRQAVMASCAIPGAVAPLREGERILSDGGIICLIPIAVARKEGADIVIAVTVDRDVSSEEELKTVVSIYHRVSEIMASKIEDYELMDADIVIIPEVGDLHWSNFSQAMNLIHEGEKATIEKLDDIRNAMPGIKKWFTLKQILKSHRKKEH